MYRAEEEADRVEEADPAPRGVGGGPPGEMPRAPPGRGGLDIPAIIAATATAVVAAAAQGYAASLQPLAAAVG